MLTCFNDNSITSRLVAIAYSDYKAQSFQGTKDQRYLRRRLVGYNYCRDTFYARPTHRVRKIARQLKGTPNARIPLR